MRYAFRHKLEISSHYVMIHRVAVLSGVEPVWYHCCVNSCMAFTGVHADLKQCQFKDCKEPRFAADGRPRRLFCYLPIILRLQGFFQIPKKVEQLLYRHNYEHIPGTISDVFDSENYRNLRKRKVVVDARSSPIAISPANMTSPSPSALIHISFSNDGEKVPPQPPFLPRSIIFPQTRVHISRT